MNSLALCFEPLFLSSHASPETETVTLYPLVVAAEGSDHFSEIMLKQVNAVVVHPLN